MYKILQAWVCPLRNPFHDDRLDVSLDDAADQNDAVLCWLLSGAKFGGRIEGCFGSVFGGSCGAVFFNGALGLGSIAPSSSRKSPSWKLFYSTSSDRRRLLRDFMEASKFPVEPGNNREFFEAAEKS